MDYELNEQQEELLGEAEYLLRREKLLDFLNSPKQFFQRRRVGYYEERLLYHLRWLAAQDEGEEDDIDE